ncbi:MAG: hypothetical protein OXC11_12340, partial [Rhodospirillales bacterium]|nr:hypothetical protein [Rhodospirillales bacterium]
MMKQTAPLCARRRKRRPFAGVAASCAAFLAFLAPTGPTVGQTPPFNYTSHSPQFIERLLAGRVWVWRKEAASSGERSVAAYAFFPDGRLSQCLGLKLKGGERWRPVTSDRWRAGRSITAGTMLALHAPLRKPKPFWTPVFYNPATGAVWTETNSRFWVGSRRNWTVLDRGWIQEGWPAAFREVCPDLPLPPGMKIEERQTALDWEAMRKQAPDAIVRKFPGSTATSPGRTGLGRSHGSRTSSA